MTITIHLCTSCDNNYYTGLVGLIKSILQNSNKNNTTLHILFTNISIRKRHILQKLCCNTNLSLDFIDMSKFHLKTQPINMGYWTQAIFYRLMIPKIFNSLQRVLYLDADTLVVSDLADLYNTDLQNNLIAMVYDKTTSRAKELNILKYFNSGVILFDIQYLNKFNFTKKCIQWLQNYKQTIRFPDQDAISVVCQNKILRLPRQYNSQCTMEDDFNKYNNNITPFVIHHFLGKIKPWNTRSVLWQFQIYKQYMFRYIKLYIYLKKCILYIAKYICHYSEQLSIINDKLYTTKKYYIFNIYILHTRNFIDDLHNKYIQYINYFKTKDV